ncbi:MAG: 2OG-Fe(II) oxygenase family protein, partial [Sphingomonas sp.]|nr:2OG-Fe(II) oxygenase family protein [Sphingomonas sp.]
YDALDEAVEMARRANMGEEHWQDYALIAAIECRLVDRADALIHALGIQPGSPMAVWVIRHLIREGRIDQAVRRIDMELATDQRTGIWPYAETAWRMAGDARHQWLCPPELVSVTDLTTFLPPLADLADTLRRLHNATGAFLDQSVRGGTQTDGPLFSRIDPVLQHTRTAVVHAVEAYLRTLPAVDAAHPTLSPRRDRDIRFAGSWSVRLGSGGHHSNHVHPMGWISSALYVALPDAIDAAPGDEAGWLTIGMPPTDLIALPPHQAIKPRPGQLVLFPSWLWHGTRPFSQGERLTIAFDIAPRQ